MTAVAEPLEGLEEQLEAAWPDRFTAARAWELSSVARVAGATTPTARRVLEVLLRSTRGRLAVTRPTRWLAGQVGASRYPTVCALHALVAAGLVEVVVAGSGRTVSSYRVRVPRVLSLYAQVNPDDRGAVHPGESRLSSVPDQDPRGLETGPQGSRFQTPGVSKQDPRGLDSRPPSAGGRARTRGYLAFTSTTTPPPPGVSPHLELDEDSPAARGGAPSKIDEEKCPHGRTAAQGGCRPCGTTSRAAKAEQDRARREAAAAARRAQAAQRAAARAAEEAAREAGAFGPPAGWRETSS